VSSFFRAVVVRAGVAIDSDLDVAWLSQREARTELTKGSHGWTVVQDSA